MKQYHWKNLSLEDVEGEVWGSISGLPSTYHVSNLGRVKNLRVNSRKCVVPKMLKSRCNPQGYVVITFSLKNRSKVSAMVHRLVAAHFVPNPDNKPLVCHIDDDPMNPMWENLFWGTQMDNVLDCINKKRRKTYPKKIKPPKDILIKRKLSIEKAEQIREMYAKGCGYAELSRIFAVHKKSIYEIVKNRYYKKAAESLSHQQPAVLNTH